MRTPSFTVLHATDAPLPTPFALLFGTLGGPVPVLAAFAGTLARNFVVLAFGLALSIGLALSLSDDLNLFPLVFADLVRHLADVHGGRDMMHLFHAMCGRGLDLWIGIDLSE